MEVKIIRSRKSIYVCKSTSRWKDIWPSRVNWKYEIKLRWSWKHERNKWDRKKNPLTWKLRNQVAITQFRWCFKLVKTIEEINVIKNKRFRGINWRKRIRDREN
jgi:hypothetical protein